MKGALYARWLEAGSDTLDEFVAAEREDCRKRRRARRQLEHQAQLQYAMQHSRGPEEFYALMQNSRPYIDTVGSGGGFGGIEGLPGQLIPFPRRPRLARFFFGQ